jgi:curved DNA-binding protein CbpA
MKRIEDQTYYEILEINPTATTKEIQRAYDRAKETFHTDSLAMYSLFSEKEVKDLQIRIEEAYRVLMDNVLRAGYDQSHLSPAELMKAQDFRQSPETMAESRQVKSSLPPPPEPPVGQEPLVYRGRTLKQIRERSGMDLKSVSSQTKITPRILEWIEEEALDKLPPEVYLKGFLRAYAQCLGLVPQKVIDGYLQFTQESKRK